MRPVSADIDPRKPIVRVPLTRRPNWIHPNGTLVPAGDYTYYSAVMKTGETRVFVSIRTGDTSYDWFDVTGQVNVGFFCRQ
jgi:hypothetical protein